jgi:adenylate cyclase
MQIGFMKDREGNKLEKDLFFETLKSERMRNRILIGIFGLLFLFSTAGEIMKMMNIGPILSVFGRNFPTGWLMVLSLFVIGYECVLYILVGLAIQKRFVFPEPARYGNAFGEVTFISIALVAFCMSVSPVFAFGSPVPFFYFLPVVLSTLRLSLPLSLFTGIIGGVELLAVSVWFLPLRGADNTAVMASFVPFLSRCFVLALSGLVAGLVAREIRHRIEASLRISADRERVISMFGQHVSPAVVNQLLSQPADYVGETRHVTVMFLDIRDFTRYSEKRSPEEIIGYLNALFGQLITVVNRNYGIINKFLGDGFMAVFGAPIATGRDAENALRAALDICERVEELNAAGTIPPTRIGIGLHSGPAVTGNVGSSERKEYTIIGDTVNLASRVEQLNKPNGSTLLVTGAVHAAVTDAMGADPEKLDPVLVKGREEPVEIWRYR